MVNEIMRLQFLTGKQSIFVPFVEILDMLKTPAELRNGRKTSLKNLNPLQLQP
jgi:hypothetical protein